MLPGQGLPPGQGMPPARCMWVKHAPPPFPGRAMPLGREMSHSQQMPFKQGIPPGRGMPHEQPTPFVPGIPPTPFVPGIPPGRGMSREQLRPFEQGMPHGRRMPHDQQPMPFVRRMQFERGMPYDEPILFEQGMPPGRGVPHGQPMPFVQGMPPGRGMPHAQPMPFEQGMSPEQSVPPGKTMWIERGMPFQPGSSPTPNRSRGNSRFCLEPPGDVHHHRWANGSFLPSSSVHPYRNSQRAQGLHYCSTRLGVSSVGFYLVKLHPCIDEISSVSLLSCISHILGNTIIFAPQWSGKTFSFIVDQYNVAQRLLNQDNLISLWRGIKLRIQVEPKIPAFCVDDDMKQAIISVLRPMLTQSTTTADLTKFHTNRIFIEKKMLCSLNLQSVLGHVVDVLFSLAPNIVMLKLDDNSLTSLEEAGMVLGVFGRLTALSLAGNKISSFAELGHLTALNLEELVLRANNCTLSLNRLDYENKVHAVLPTVTVLDGQEIFGAFHWNKPEFPVWKFFYVPENTSKTLKLLSVNFINRFRTLYDEMGRSNLVEAYHPEAVMSLSCDLNGGSKWRLYDYIRYDRSFLIDENKMAGNSKPILFRGPEAIVSALKTLPNTDHYIEYLTFDLIEMEGNAAQIIISGFFKEFNQNKFHGSGKPFKHFHRCLIVVYNGNSVQIVNDSLLIRYPNNSQLNKLALLRENRLQEYKIRKHGVE